MQGNLINRVMEQGGQPKPKVGMGATQCMWSDRHAYTIVTVFSEKHIVVQKDKAIRADKNGMSESQEYTYQADPEGTKYTVTLRKNGKWVTKGEGLKNGTGWMLGERREYYDYSF